MNRIVCWSILAAVAATAGRVRADSVAAGKRVWERAKIQQMQDGRLRFTDQNQTQQAVLLSTVTHLQVDGHEALNRAEDLRAQARLEEASKAYESALRSESRSDLAGVIRWRLMDLYGRNGQLDRAVEMLLDLARQPDFLMVVKDWRPVSVAEVRPKIREAAVAMLDEALRQTRMGLAGEYIRQVREYISGHGTEATTTATATGGSAVCIVYIIDGSGSMVGSFDFVQKEMRRSIEQLQPEQMFQVIFFSSGQPVEFSSSDPGTPPVYRLNFATDRMKIKACQFIDKMVAAGQTDPRLAFRKAFALRPKPDLIYFLTDGAFGLEIADDVKKWNANRKTIINTIAFRDRAGEVLLKRIADENGGTYVYIQSWEPTDGPIGKRSVASAHASTRLPASQGASVPNRGSGVPAPTSRPVRTGEAIEANQRPLPRHYPAVPPSVSFFGLGSSKDSDYLVQLPTGEMPGSAATANAPEQSDVNVLGNQPEPVQALKQRAAPAIVSVNMVLSYLWNGIAGALSAGTSATRDAILETAVTNANRAIGDKYIVFKCTVNDVSKTSSKDYKISANSIHINQRQAFARRPPYGECAGLRMSHLVVSLPADFAVRIKPGDTLMIAGFPKVRRGLVSSKALEVGWFKQDDEYSSFHDAFSIAMSACTVTIRGQIFDTEFDNFTEAVRVVD